MGLSLDQLLENAKVWEKMAQFDKPLDLAAKAYLREEGFADARTRAIGCMGWIWSQWLFNTYDATSRKRVEVFVERGMEMQDLSCKFYMRPVHDLYLLHCAIFASVEPQIKILAKRMVDASGWGKYSPRNDGELYTSAWCGMLKFWILDDHKKATQQFQIASTANRDIAFRTVGKELVTAWLGKDWKAFQRCQKKEFNKLWSRARKDGTIQSEHGSEIEINMNKLASVQQLWCWAHCGMALLAYREGADVATDELWFPTSALKAIERV